MTALAIASMFTGAVIFVWGLRALRNGRVKVIYFTMRSWTSTMIFGIIAMLCGILMIIAGPAATSPLTAELADMMVKVSLYLFGVGWVIGLVLEALARLGSGQFPQEVYIEKRGKLKTGAAQSRPSGAAPNRLQLAKNRLLTSGSQLYARVFSPYQPRHLQEQWRSADEKCERQKRRESKNRAANDQEELLR